MKEQRGRHDGWHEQRAHERTTHQMFRHLDPLPKQFLRFVLRIPVWRSRRRPVHFFPPCATSFWISAMVRGLGSGGVDGVVTPAAQVSGSRPTLSLMVSCAPCATRYSTTLSDQRNAAPCIG